MVFSSTVFLFLFLPLVLASHLLVPARWRNAHLLAASLLFYAWGEVWVVLALLGSILGNHALGLAVARTRAGPRGRLVLGLSVSANLVLLAVFKYADFLVGDANALLGLAGLPLLPLPGLKLPIGISFYTFQAVSYLVDVFRGHVQAQRSRVAFGLYLALFPQLIAGPIVRYGDIAREIAARRLSWAGFAAGVPRFVVGLAKKMLVANTLSELADVVFDGDVALLDARLAWIGIAAYTLQIYFDFSGYSDMAIGLGHMLGFTLPENFRHPYVARSVREIWTRWHVTLTTWFRDYVYVPMGGNRRGPARVAFNLVTVFVLCGLWHGASWNYVVFGLYQGLFLVLERQPAVARGLGRLWRPLQHAYALGAWMIGLAIFRTETLAEAGRAQLALLGLARPAGELALLVRNDQWLALGVGALASLPWVPWIRRRAGATGDALDWGPGWRGVLLHGGAACGLAALLLLSVLQLAGGTHNPFLYFRF